MRTVVTAACGGLLFGWLPGVLLLSVIDFNLSFFASSHPILADESNRRAIGDCAMIAFAVVALCAWRFKEELPLAKARKQLMAIDAGASEQDRQRQFERPTLTVGWSYFVQGGLVAWLLTPVLTAVRLVILVTVALLWYGLESYGKAPIDAEGLVTQLLGLAEVGKTS